MDLVGLLRWRSQKRQIPSVLTSLLKIDGEEIVKVGMFILIMQSLVLSEKHNSDFDNLIVFNYLTVSSRHF